MTSKLLDIGNVNKILKGTWYLWGDLDSNPAEQRKRDELEENKKEQSPSQSRKRSSQVIVVLEIKAQITITKKWSSLGRLTGLAQKNGAKKATFSLRR